MKKIFVLIFFASMLYVSHGYAQCIDASYAQDTNSNVYITRMEIGMPVRLFNAVTITPYGSWETWAMMKNYSTLDGWPFRDRYDMGIRAEYKNFYVDFNHYCVHNVVYYDKVKTPSTKWIDTKQYGSRLTTIKVGYRKTFSTLSLFE